jgi:hypothetical protein
MVLVIMVGALADKHVTVSDIVHVLSRVVGLRPLRVADDQLSPLSTTYAIGGVNVTMFMCVNASGEYFYPSA